MAEYFDTTGQALTDADLDDRYDTMLDEVYGTVSIAGMDFETSRALKELDPIAYRCGRADWISAEIDDEQLWEECWLVGSNLPGCLPDSEPEPCPSWADAWQTLKIDLQDMAEYAADPMAYQDTPAGQELLSLAEAESERVLALLASDPEVPEGPVNIEAFDRIYWIAKAE